MCCAPRWRFETHRQMEALKIRDQANLTLAKGTQENRTATAIIEGRERIRIEFFKTYDVMTGIRIAATLGGFFSMMILLVLYKNYCKPHKTLSEEQLNAAVTAAVEEEDRALKAALEATSFYTSLSKPRESLESTSPALCSPRFSSVGGGYSPIAPPMRLPFVHQRGKSLPGSALRFTSSTSPSTDRRDPLDGDCSEEEDFDIDCQLPDYFAYGNYLSVPADRRLSSITCSSADSSYLERRGSAFEMGLPAPPPFIKHDREKSFCRNEEPWDYYYPIDIQVIQPTPDISPATSEKNLSEEPISNYGLKVPGYQDRMHRLSVDRSEIGLAPLASISSLGSFSSQSSPIPSRKNLQREEGCCCHEDSVGSDSVFMDEIDTEDEVDEFSTDSDFEYDGFDDDYSFCESGHRPVSRCEKRTLQFASFDSYDASIAQDSLSEDKEDKAKAINKSDDKAVIKRALSRQYSTDLRRHPSVHEGNRVKRKLVKTHSEPRGQKMKQLPLWIEKGRSGYIPKRQLSAPSSRRKQMQEAAAAAAAIERQEIIKKLPLTPEPEIKRKKSQDDGTQPPKKEPIPQDESPPKSSLPLPSNSSSSDSLTLTPVISDSVGTTQIQGLNPDMPLRTPPPTSLHSPQNKRGRLQKQKASLMMDDAECEIFTKKDESRNLSLSVKSDLLKPPNVSISGSCERLANPNLYGQMNMLGVPQIQINMGSCEKLNVITDNQQTEVEDNPHTEVFISRTSSQETIC